jgi:lipopolysaccharide biosynthesis regulator YciM
VSAAQWFLLLLPVAAASGWIMGRYTTRQGRRRSAEPLDRYLEGVRYLLDDQTDQALETFMQVVEVDGDTFETHLIIGRLFRKRGEVDRAIRLHQSLAERPSLTETQRWRARYEMGRDFLLAGMLDRAEEVFRELVVAPSVCRDALSGLRSVYEIQRDWPQAIEVGVQLLQHEAPVTGLRVAHYHCEWATQLLDQQNLEAAEAHLQQALDLQPGLPRALLLQARHAELQGHYARSVQFECAALQRTPSLAPLVIPKLVRLHVQKGWPLQGQTLEETLQALASQPRMAIASITLMRLYRRTQRPEDALQELRRILAQRPVPVSGLLEAVRWMKILPAVQPYASELAAFEKALVEQLRHQALYQCTHCGFQGRAHAWQCPSCRRWDTFKGIELDLEDPGNASV